ncbi:MAG: hypothetical protein JRI68_25185, partial [Deltaproteobacteria bacterium]|nr:hypothetical protein [Deltaproteobacteria bacterium]
MTTSDTTTGNPLGKTTTSWLVGGATALVAVGTMALSAPACSELADACAEERCWESGAGGSAAAGGNGGGGGTGGSGDCDPTLSPMEDGCVLTDALGIFVRKEGDDEAAGTREAPVETLEHAIELAADTGKRVYACSQTFVETVEVPAGLELYGGLDCAADWQWTDTRTVVTGQVDGAPTLTLTDVPSGQLTLISDVDAIGHQGVDPGASSIAVVVDHAEARFVRCQLRAGAAADGSDGTDAPQFTAGSGVLGNAGGNFNCSTTPVAGGAQQVNGSCTESVGGKGGDGGVTAGQNGQPGQPSVPSHGQPGPGEPASGTWNCPTSSMNGADGADGDEGEGGTGTGTLTALGIYTGADGADGTDSGVGQGGGGGGGRKQPIGCPVTGVGSGGGSGGSGGCRGQSGGGGLAGGSSIALVILDGTVSFEEVVLTTAAGGDGGDGGDRQLGGGGEPGGPGGTQGCAGGSGGD